jgi:hypothetical protein
MIKVTKKDFRNHAVENGLCLAGLTKRPLGELVTEIEAMEPYNGLRDEVTVTASGMIQRHFTRNGEPAKSSLDLTKHATIYRLNNGFFIIHNQYPATPGTSAWEQNLVYA